MHKIPGLVAAGLLAVHPLSLFAKEMDMTRDETAVLQAVQEMTEAFMAGQIDRVMESYTQDLAIAFEPGAPVTGAGAAREMFAAFAAIKPVFTYGGHEVIVAGDIALHIAPWTMQGRAPDGSAVADSGLSVAVLRRQPDGRWKLVVDNPHGSRLLE